MRHTPTEPRHLSTTSLERSLRAHISELRRRGAVSLLKEVLSGELDDLKLELLVAGRCPLTAEAMLQMLARTDKADTQEAHVPSRSGGPAAAAEAQK